ncbi:MAG TPA: PIN domain nuclease [Gammaproteobacteria bacterium]|nr:PIN domain nuclease [Gammaproteobacteria bacterium]
MVLVDSSVWIDYFIGVATRQTDLLDRLLGREPVAVGDLVLAEVLQGFRIDADYRAARAMLGSLVTFEMLGAARAIKVAENYRALRRQGVTVRKTTDAVIATFCIEQQLPLLYSDRDFDPFVTHLGLNSAD